MNNATKFNRTSACSILLVLSLLVLAPHSVSAQYLIDVKLNKKNFLTYESVEATVTISNRSGSDIVMGGPQGDSWLAFDVTDPQGHQVPPLRARVDDGFVFKSGETIGRTVPLSSAYSFSEYGSYNISARVYHPSSQQYYSSVRTRANFTNAKPLGLPLKFGVPAGFPGAGQVRSYNLAILRDDDRTYLYVRIVDEKTQLKLSTLSMGTIVLVNDPQLTVDRENKLHLLFMTAPHIYAQRLVDTQGAVEKPNYYKEIGSDRPHLVVGAGDSILVEGGEPYDPNAPGPKTGAKSIGKKPPGL